MSAKHTPGPWSHRNGRIFQTDRPELTIANVARAHDGDYNAVNGDLLAAAPELLEALKTTLGNIMSLGPAGALESVPMPFRVWADVVKSAIDKAEGNV